VKQRKRGVTILELIIAMGILAILTTVVFSVFLSNHKNLTRTGVKSELQQEAQQILEKITKSGMQAERIYSISNTESLIDKNTANVSISNLSFVTDTGERCIFNFNSLTKELRFTGLGLTDGLIGSNVKDFKASIINGTASINYGNCSGVKLTLVLSRRAVGSDMIDYEVTTNVYFRNNTGR
jgi:prepilin-type N-terminal cleavage/methylation domain-containing protein